MTRDSGNVRKQKLRVLRLTKNMLLILVSFLIGAVAHATCIPPKDLALEIKSHRDGTTYARLGQWYAHRHQFSCAADEFREAVKAEPTSSEYFYFLGLSLYSSGQPGAAVLPLQQSLRIAPTSDRAHLALGTAFDAVGRRADAEMQWRLTLATKPDSEEALVNLSRDLLADAKYSEVIELLQPIVKAGHCSEQLGIDLSVAYTKTGLLQQASELLGTMLQVHRSSDSVAEARAGVLMLQSRFQDAVSVLSPVIKRHPSDVAVEILYLHTLVLAHDPVAKTLAIQILRLKPHQWEVLYLMGLMSQRADDFVGARRYFETSISANPLYGDAHYRLGAVLATLKDDAGAKSQLEAAIALGVQTPEVHFELARVLRSMNDAKDAQQQLQLYQAMLKAQEGRAQAEAKAEQGDQFIASGDVKQAVEAFRSACEFDPSEPIFAYKLAMASDKGGDITAERIALQRAVDLSPGMALAQNQLGYLDFSANQTDRAIEHFQLAVRADPFYSKAWLNLAAALCLQSKWEEARGAIAHVLALEPNNNPARELLRNIDQLEPQH